MDCQDSDYQKAIERVRSEFNFDFVALSLVPPGEHPVLTWQYASGNLNERYKRIVLASGRGVAGIAFKTGKSLMLSDVYRDIPYEDMHEYPIIIAEGLGSLCAIPLWKGGEIRGILLAGFRYVHGVDEELVQKLGAYLARGFIGFSVDELAAGARIALADDERPVYELMTHRILEAQEHERRRISRELHDGVAQDVLGVQMLLRQSRYGSAEEKDEAVKHAIEGLGVLLDEVRRMAVELRPSSLDDLGLEATLSAHAAWMSANFGVRIHFTGNIGAIRYRQAIETVVYRICQEAVLNACKYSNSEDIEVVLDRQGDNLVLTVNDDGVGFDSSQVEVKGSGLGLEGMLERAELVDGHISVTTSPGRGTMVELIVPIDERNEIP